MLQQEVGTGRLTLGEFSDRSAAAYAARTVGDLDELTADLPAAEARRHLTRTQVLVAIAVLVAVIGIVMLAVFASGLAGPATGMMNQMMPAGAGGMMGR